MPAPIRVFFAYAEQDQALRDELAAHLTYLQLRGALADWAGTVLELASEGYGVVVTATPTAAEGRDVRRVTIGNAEPDDRVPDGPQEGARA